MNVFKDLIVSEANYAVDVSLTILKTSCDQ